MRSVLILLAALLCWPAAARASGKERYFALIVGYNGKPGTADAQVQPLRYADDDALAFYQLQKETGADAILLTIPDADTRRRYPVATETVRAPTSAELFQAVDTLAARMEAAARAGDTPTLTIFYSGHGARTQSDGGGEAALTLHDGLLSQTALHERVLGKLRSGIVHLVIDACYAEALVRSRDVDAQTVDLAPSQMATLLSQTASARHPNVGLVIASRSNAIAHEWDLYQSGVFSHEVISGLRGAADVNGDGRVEYSELGAFLNAANREVVDPRARVRSVIQPPAVRARAALICIGPGARTGWLVAIPSSAGQFYIEDARGNRIVDGRAELGFAMAVAVPAGEPLFVRNNDREAELLIRAGNRQPFDRLDFRDRPLRSRGAMESSLQAGLFVMPFGPAYYSGYTDRQDMVSVADLPRALLSTSPAPATPATSTTTVLRWGLRGAAGALVASSAIFGALAVDARADFNATNVEREAAAASDRYKLDTRLALTFLLSAGVCAAASYFVGRLK
jgi:hypothetical protein